MRQLDWILERRYIHILHCMYKTIEMNLVKNKIFVIRLNTDTTTQNLFAFIFAKDLIQLALSTITSVEISRVFVNIIEIILILIVWKNIQYTFTRVNICFFFFWTIFLFISALTLGRERDIYINLVLQSIISCFPLYFIGKATAKHNIGIINSMRLVPAIVAFSYILYYIVSKGNMYGNIGYSQWLGYALLPSCCIAINLVINGNFLQLPFMLVLLWGVVASGARGPLLCVIFAVALLILGRADLKSFKWWGLILICVLFGISIYNYYEEVLYLLIQLFDEMNISTRTLNALLTESFTQSDGRNSLANGVWEGIRSNPFGMGIFHDRQFLRPYLRGAMSSEGTYAHNLFLEFLLQYGIVFGTIIIIVFIWLMVKCFINVRNNKEQFMCFVVLVASGFFPLLISSSYLQWENFYLMMGYFVTSRLAKTEAG